MHFLVRNGWILIHNSLKYVWGCFIGHKSIMVWCHQEISHYLFQCNVRFSLESGYYHQTSNISCTLPVNIIVDHSVSDVVGASPVSPAQTQKWLSYLSELIKMFLVFYFQSTRKVSKCGYLFVAPETFDFQSPLDRTRVSVEEKKCLLHLFSMSNHHFSCTNQRLYGNFLHATWLITSH